MKAVTLNADIGESFGAWKMGADELIMPHIDCANIACGFHASDPSTMMTTVRLAKQYGVTIGAHPAYPDLVGFGRRHMACKPEEVTALVQYQVGALQGVCTGLNAKVEYVKPHGALYNDMLNDGPLFDAVCQAIAALQGNGKLPLMVMATPENHAWKERAAQFGVALWFEGFADRAYDDSGKLRSRQYDDAVHSEAQAMLEQAKAFTQEKPIASVNGTPLNISIDSLCVHGDNPRAIDTVKQLKQIVKGNNE